MIRSSGFVPGVLAELLSLKALVIRSEQDLVISPSPAYEEQKTLADHADFDFANIKELLDDGKVSRLDAIRLNNEFRRIGPERDGLHQERDGRRAKLSCSFTRMRSPPSSSSSCKTRCTIGWSTTAARTLAVGAVGRGRGHRSRDSRRSTGCCSMRGSVRSRSCATRASHTLVQVTRRLAHSRSRI